VFFAFTLAPGGYKNALYKQTPFFPDFILTGFLMTRLIFQDFVPQMKILPYGDDFVPNRRESHDT